MKWANVACRTNNSIIFSSFNVNQQSLYSSFLYVFLCLGQCRCLKRPWCFARTTCSMREKNVARRAKVLALRLKKILINTHAKITKGLPCLRETTRSAFWFTIEFYFDAIKRNNVGSQARKEGPCDGYVHTPHRLLRSLFLLTNDLVNLSLAHHWKIIMISTAYDHGLLQQTKWTMRIFNFTSILVLFN